MRRKDKKFFIVGLAIIGYYCWFQAFYNSVRFGNMLPYSGIYDFLIGVAENFPPIFFICLMNLYIVFHVISFADLRKKIFFDLLLSLTGCMIVNCIYVACYSFICRLGPFDVGVIEWTGAILNDIIILLCVELIYYFTHLLRLRQDVNEAACQIIRYQYDALKAQVNPHFLFNSLNILSSLVAIDTEKSKVFIRELAKMYRYILDQQNKETVSVEEE